MACRLAALFLWADTVQDHRASVRCQHAASAYISWPLVLLMQVCCARLWPLSSAKAYPQADVLALLKQALGAGKVIAPHGRYLKALLRTQLQRLHAGLRVECAPASMRCAAKVQRLSSSSRPVAHV